MADQLCNGRLGEADGQLAALALCAESIFHQITHLLEALRLSLKIQHHCRCVAVLGSSQ
ncbi:hypothetical protein LMED105_11720 [Limnobacter sp. MED105]|nr:hypothetical protein LMED105_11720 [Limnobacter sp. MED105]